MDLNQVTLSKIASFCEKTRAKYSNITAFAVVQRADAESSWDIVIAGDNIENSIDLKELSSMLVDDFSRDELILFSGPILVDSRAQFATEIRRSIVVSNGIAEFKNTKMGFVYIKHAYVFFTAPLNYSNKSV